MGKTAQVIHIYQFLVQIHIDVESIRLESIYLGLVKEFTKHLAPTASVIIKVDCYLGFLVYHTPDVFLAVLACHFHSAPRLVTVYHSTLDQKLLLQDWKHLIQIFRAFDKPVVHSVAADVHLVVQQAYHLAIYRSIHVVLVEYKIGKQ